MSGLPLRQGESCPMRKEVVMRALIALIAAAALIVAGCAQSPDGAAQSASASPGSVQSAGIGASRAMVTVPEGTFIEIALNASLSSGGNSVGDDFTASVTAPVVASGGVVPPEGRQVPG